MKKKIYNGMLLVAMLFATMGSFVSCKDYDEDAYADLQGQLVDQNSTLKELINAQVAALNEQIDALKKAQDECKKNCEAWKQEITIWQEYVENNYVTVEEYNKHLAEYTAFVAENQAQHEALSKKIEELLAADEDLKAKMQAADEALKDEMQAGDEATKAELRGELLKVQTELNNLITSVQTQLGELATTVANNKAELEKAIAENKAELEKAIADNKAELEDKIESEISNLEKRVAANEVAIADLNTALSDMQKTIGGIDALLNETVKAVVEAQELAELDSIRIDALEVAFEALKEEHKNDNAALVAKIDSICNELNTVKESVNEAIELANENLKLAKAYTDSRIEEVMTEITTINTTLAQLEIAYKEADAKLQEQIDALADQLASVMKRVKENAIQIKKLMNQVDDIVESMAKLITGILVQGTENPVFGSFSLPFNIQSNVLMAYYGYAGSYGAQFPTIYPRYYVSDNEVLSEKDLEMLGVAPETLAEDGEALVSGAGKVYVTVNPSNVNFEGETLPIVNSIEEESGIKLSPLKYSDKKLTFGRSAENGFYEADATLAAEDIEKVALKLDFNASDIKATVKDVLNPLNGVNVTQVANTVVDVLGQFNQNLDANALKASWTDELGVTRSVYSQYNLATTAVKPLSYGFMSDVNVTTLPGLERAEKFINKVADKVKVRIPKYNVNIQTPTIKEIEIVDLSEDLLAEFKFLVDMDTTITVPEETIVIEAYDKNGNKIKVEPVVVGGQSIEIWVTEVVDMQDEVKDLYAELEKPIEDVNQIIEDLKNYIDDVNELLADINKINNKIDYYIDKTTNKLIDYLNKFNTKMCKLINSANKVLQPVLLVKADDTYSKLSQSLNYPSKISSKEFTFVATSYTAEFIAPSYKKLVGVTNVYSMDGSKNAQVDGGEYLTVLKAANAKAGVAEVLDGDTQLVDFSAKKGYIYEVTYTSVDFSGMVAAKKFYVTVK